ncbi:hypothetical protein ABW20_dc0109981 [Dactylellina cionopaga]|nr:hypothetical protein ABW20_dc0109981 [Dactylellina cionopaga]
MKFLTILAILTAVSAAPALEAKVEEVSAKLEKRCYYTWQHAGCFSVGSAGQIAHTTSFASGGGSWTWCTSWCNNNAPGATWANINSQNYNGQASSTCDCGTGPSIGTQYNPASSCYNPCAYSSLTVSQCWDGTCWCGGPRAYTLFQKVQVC